MSLRKIFLFIISVHLLAACGFHLKGMSPKITRPFPFHSVALDQETPFILREAWRMALLKDGRPIVLESSSSKADIVISLKEQLDRQVQTINRAGKISEFFLSYDLEAKIFKPKDKTSETVMIRKQKELGYADNQLLGKAQEEQLLYQSMREDALDTLLLRMGSMR